MRRKMKMEVRREEGRGRRVGWVGGGWRDGAGEGTDGGGVSDLFFRLRSRCLLLLPMESV